MKHYLLALNVYDEHVFVNCQCAKQLINIFKSYCTVLRFSNWYMF